LIRLEFNQSHLDYYTELDAVILYGKPSSNEMREESKPTAVANKSEVSLTANLFRQLSLSDKKTDGQEDLELNGYFDILPVGHLCRVGCEGSVLWDNLMEEILNEFKYSRTPIKWPPI